MARQSGSASFFQKNGLVICFTILMLLSLVGHALAGWRVENLEQIEHGRAAPSMAQYLTGGQFLSTLFENWESEFLQMGLFVYLTVFLRQKGSSESRPIDPAEEEPEHFPKKVQPWPVRRGGVWLKVYEHSLSLALFILFALSFVGHLVNSLRQHNEQQSLHGAAPSSLVEYLGGSQFWFESMQNWQSEFLSVVALVLLSIYLREKGSPQSKQVEAAHSATGS